MPHTSFGSPVFRANQAVAMSFDRVLPRPVALYDDPASRLHRPTSSLLEHKIMTDRDRIFSMHGKAFASPGEIQRSSCSSTLSQMQLSALNREKTGQNGHLSASFTAAPASSRQNTPVLAAQELIDGNRSSSHSPARLELAREAASQFCLCQPDPKIPRPRNAFILYRQHYQAAVVAQNPGLANPEISKIIGEQWRALSVETKEEWKALAQAEKARHQQQYPDYRYQPRRFGRDNYARNGSVSTTGNQVGSTVCNRCGGRLMNPPSTPHTPLTATVAPLSSRSLDSLSTHISTSRGNKKFSELRPSGLHVLKDQSRRSLHNQWRETESVLTDAKRRRLNRSPLQSTENSDTETYSLSSQKTYVSRPGIAYFRSHVDLSTNAYASEHIDSEAIYDPSLTLPPLRTADGNNPMTRIQTDTVMTVPVLNKIKVLAKISPPLSESNGSPSRGFVIAVEGQDLAQVKVMLTYLGQLFMDNGRYVVRVFEGPAIVARRGSISGEMGDATVDYLNVISAWHRISDEIIQFVCPKSQSPHPSVSKNLSRTGSPQSDTERSTSSSSPPSPPITTVFTTSTTTSSSQTPIALVPRYQLTTADAFASLIPINDRYKFLDHWQWMASLWRACIGPDVTVHIQGCNQEEINRHASGNPVEVRLNEARTLIVRRSPDQTKDIEEKALKRVAFEIEDFLSR